MKHLFAFLAGFLQETNGKSSQKRAIGFMAMLLLGLVTYANVMLQKAVDYMVLASLVLIILFVIGAITRLSEGAVDKFMEGFTKQKEEKKETEPNS